MLLAKSNTNGPHKGGYLYLLLFASTTICHASQIGTFCREFPDYWDLARRSQIVVKATVISVNARVRLAVDHVFKGENVGESLEFPIPAVAEVVPGKMVCGGPEFARFAAGKPCIVFLKTTQLGEYELIQGGMDILGIVEQCVKDVLTFDAMGGDESDKCKMLVDLAISAEGLRAGHPLRELNKYNKPELLELLQPLEKHSHTELYYIYLLAENQNPAATNKLIDLLRNSHSKEVLVRVINGLQRKSPQDAGISRELLKYVTHDDFSVRESAIFVLKYRHDIDASTEVAGRLDDEAPRVRGMALYYFDGSTDPAIIARIKKLTHDSDEHVRATAYRALPSASCMYYKFLLASFLDRSKWVRRAASTGKLDVIWEYNWLVVSLLLIWPSILAAGILLLSSKAPRGQQCIRVILAGTAAGYIAGMVGGYLTGRFYVGNPLFNSIILMPPVFMPLGILLAGAVSRYGKEMLLTVFPLFGGILCVVIGLISLNNALWPCLLSGFFVLDLTILLFATVVPVFRCPEYERIEHDA
ncbi:MAG TPA: HEAT repeat domain-containing protein [Sedimentisphaerales bacterium]|nr:HEAT repeat domain-containing protein [Sedimentisphaerales bacterium]